MVHMRLTLASSLVIIGTLLTPLVSATSTHNWWTIKENFGDIAEMESSISVPSGSDPTNTFWMADGWGQGYFGMQHNEANTRTILFSVWDDGNGGNVTDIAKGKGVLVEDFGGEGTGAHAKRLYKWKVGEKIYFRVRAKVNKQNNYTDYSGWWRTQNVNNNRWNFVATFRAQNVTDWLTGVYGFLENFGSDHSEIREGFWGDFSVTNTDGKKYRPKAVTYSHTEPEPGSNYEYKYMNGRSYMRTDGPKNEGLIPPTNPK